MTIEQIMLERHDERISYNSERMSRIENFSETPTERSFRKCSKDFKVVEEDVTEAEIFFKGKSTF